MAQYHAVVKPDGRWARSSSVDPSASAGRERGGDHQKGKIFAGIKDGIPFRDARPELPSDFFEDDNVQAKPNPADKPAEPVLPDL